MKQTTSKKEMKGALWDCVLEKGWKIDMKVLQKNEFIGNGQEFENDAKLNREPVKRFQKWNRMGKPRRPRDNPS